HIIWIFCIFNILFNQFNLVIERPWDIKYSYEQNGFLYSFVKSYLGYRRVSPEEYSQKNIIEIKNNILNDIEQVGNHFPNIIMIQLESFFDPMSINGISYSEDPIPNFREFSNRYTSGFLSVPTYGGGTPRSEFEVLTAFNIDFLVPGEIPHQTILKSNSVHSYANKLSSLNYTNHFFHNYKGDFYGRNIVYKNLGFDTFSSIELLPPYELSLNNWPKDETLILPMLQAIKSTEGPDFIYTITMESHGSYSDENMILPIEVYGDYDNEIIYQLKNYVNILKGVDDFIGSLISSINNLDEDTVVVLFSDHLPSLEYFKTIPTDDSTLFLTPFVIVDNFSLQKNDFDCEMYQLTTKLSEILNLGYSPIERLHSVLVNNPKYLSALEIIQYDILFGKNLFSSEAESFKSNKIQYGLNQVLIKDIHVTEELIVVEGENFNYSSTIFIDNKEMPTRYINDKVLEIDKPKNFELLDIRQVTSNGIVLNQTEKIHIFD
ncbi:sulfatase-like hydrolase/transferase, partial [Turicibacter sanguinis]|nr:sulfatase-like hydrolase/transferase [Turicibacter sanguinis]